MKDQQLNFRLYKLYCIFVTKTEKTENLIFNGKFLFYLTYLVGLNYFFLTLFTS